MICVLCFGFFVRNCSTSVIRQWLLFLLSRCIMMMALDFCFGSYSSFFNHRSMAYVCYGFSLFVVIRSFLVSKMRCRAGIFKIRKCYRPFRVPIGAFRYILTFYLNIADYFKFQLNYFQRKNEMHAYMSSMAYYWYHTNGMLFCLLSLPFILTKPNSNEINVNYN